MLSSHPAGASSAVCKLMQIEEESLKMAQYTAFRFVCIVGGA